MTEASYIRVDDRYAAEHPGADPKATEVVINALVVGALLTERMDSLLRAFGLTVGSFNLLTIVAGAGEPLSPTDIARRSPNKVTTATVTGLLDTCERNGLLRRSPHPDDRRKVLVSLTPAGRALLAAIGPELIAAEKRWAGPLTATRREALLRGLGELRLALEADA